VNAPESVRIALRGLGANRLRSSLTMLGILIGVGSVIVLVAVGNGSSVAVQKQIENLGSRLLLVLPQRGFGGAFGGTRSNVPQSQSTALTLTDVKALEDRTNNPDIATVSPVVSTQVTATWQGNSHAPQSFVGTSPSYGQARNYTTREGRFLSQADYDSHGRVVVIGQTVATDLFGSADPVGQTIQLNNQNFTVVGLLNAKGSNGFQDQDDVVIAPLTTVQDTLTGFGSLNQIAVQAASTQSMDAASAEIEQTLLSSHHVTNPAQAGFTVLNQASLLATSSSTNQVFTVLLGAVAAISLLVGGIGVMNIMLVTVTERTREIGIRKAVGARRSDILAQFMAEAVLLSIVGGLAGVVAGLVGSNFRIVGVTPVVAPYSVFLAFGVAVAVGLFFGIYPANRAASLRPIEALRYE
jgi:putative ABC transport system permease protein